jgi:choline dehydrogenase-like flavoprotein
VGNVSGKNLIQNFFGPNWHPMGTAKIGLESANSICNSNLQVHGIENLYLLSGAVFPTGSNANPTFTVLALANRLIESSVFQFSSVQDS